MSDFSPHVTNLRPHPLAVALIERLRAVPRARILEIGAGSGRNRAALLAAGFEVHSAGDICAQESAYDAAISTHALLHGTRESIAATLAQIADALKPDAPLYATFGSARDARFGKGTLVAANTYAADSGDEAGVPHTYFTRAELLEAIEVRFIVESLDEACVDDIVGRWAHAHKPSGSVHFFLVARNRRIDA